MFIGNFSISYRSRNGQSGNDFKSVRAIRKKVLEVITGFALDNKQAKSFDCESCDSSLQKLRNCLNLYGKSASPILVNGKMYRECPKSLIVGQYELNYIFNVYSDCKESNALPYATNICEITAYCREVFSFLDDIVNTYRDKENKRLEDQSKKK